MDIDSLKMLLLVEQHGSLSAAANSLDLAVSSVGRRLDALETRLGLRLLDRRASGVRLTMEGKRILALSVPMIEAANAIERAATAFKNDSEAIRVSISATEFVVSDVLAPALPALQTALPTLSVTLQSQSAVVSLAAREADIAIRMAQPTGASLFIRKLASLELGCFAAPEYLGSRDAASLNLGDEDLLIYDDSYGRLNEVDWVSAAGLDRAVRLRTGSTRALLSSAASGAGIGILPVVFAERAGLRRVSIPFAIPRRDVWLAIHRDLRRVPEIRVAAQWITQTFKTLREAGPQSALNQR